MKKVLCVLIATPSFLMAQQQVTSVQTAKPKAVQPQTISRTSASNQNNTSNSNTYPMTVSSHGAPQHSVVGSSSAMTAEQIDNTIAAIQQKIQYVVADSTRKAKAEASGWFTQMNQTIAELEQKKQNLTNN